MRYSVVILLFFSSCTRQSDTNHTNISTSVNYFQTKYIEYQRVNIGIAQKYIDSIERISKPVNFIYGIGLTALDKGLLEHIKGNFNLAINFNEKALTIFSSLKNDTLVAKSLSAIGISYWQKGENDKALQYLFKALKINEQLNTRNEIASVYNQISMVYQSQNKLALAENFAYKSLSIINHSEPGLSHISTFHNLANIYGMQGNYKEALKYDSIGLKYCEQLNVEFNKSMFYDNIANCLYFANDWPNAIGYHLKAITIDSSFGNNKQLGDTYSNLGAIYEEQQNYKAAIDCYKKSIELCRKSGYKNGLRNVLEQLSNLYFKTNKTADAYQLLKESMAVKDSIINEASEQKIAELQTLFETEKKKQQIEQQELKISRRNILLLAMFVILLFSLITYYLLYNRYKLKQEQKLQQELLNEAAKRSKAILESEENERQRLARELHDGVGQLLTATKLNLSTLTSADLNDDKHKLQNSMDILDDSIKEIRNISHNMVPDVLLKYGLRRAIEDFISRINQTNKLSIHFECNGFEETSLDDTSKLMLYRIIQETVNNSIKYAQATEMTIQLSADAEEISLLMEDNGKGFDVAEVKQKGGIGLKNMQLRTDYLKGQLEIESSPQNGTTIIIEIPLS